MTLAHGGLSDEYERVLYSKLWFKIDCYISEPNNDARFFRHEWRFDAKVLRKTPIRCHFGASSYISILEWRNQILNIKTAINRPSLLYFEILDGGISKFRPIAEEPLF